MARIVSMPPVIDTDAPNPRTRRLRPTTALNSVEIATARQMAKAGFDVPSIAAHLGHATPAVELALAAMRTKVIRKDRATLNAGIESYRFVLSERRRGEAIWQTLDRLFSELSDSRGGP